MEIHLWRLIDFDGDLFYLFKYITFNSSTTWKMRSAQQWDFTV